MRVVGDKNAFALEIDNQLDDRKQMCAFNIYIDRKNICCEDNLVYIPQFASSLDSSLDYLKKKIDYIKFERYFFGLSVPEAHQLIKSKNDEDNIYSFHRFVDWGATTDNALCFLIPVDGFLFLSCEFEHNTNFSAKEVTTVFGTRITPYELIQIIECAINVLKIK